MGEPRATHSKFPRTRTASIVVFRTFYHCVVWVIGNEEQPRSQWLKCEACGSCGLNSGARWLHGIASVTRQKRGSSSLALPSLLLALWPQEGCCSSRNRICAQGRKEEGTSPLENLLQGLEPHSVCICPLTHLLGSSQLPLSPTAAKKAKALGSRTVRTPCNHQVAAPRTGTLLREIK